MVTLHEPTQAEFDEWFALSTQRQAEDRASVSGRSVPEELKGVEMMVPQLLPNGKETPGHTFRLARDTDARVLASVWFGSIPGMPDTARFLFDIYVIPTARRQGHGRRILATLIGQLQDGGASEVYLNVLSNNRGAIALYKDLGFAITKEDEDSRNLEMKKTL